ncbi:glutathione-dependent formaldehyde-activating enzyme [Microthyrium microscopicum]|uniref:Glutathione-dependent formaldehyde-activating enzyme n=1 Tax=Microthyrium microscopicum TaxID=703497 RepID=A0A6A6TUT1_9PEZI|nr:glutathione-dependent formaldehyde-activating enzyme [Microthyrium microscopicum]
MASAQTLTYLGNCHCGGYRFEISLPRIESAISCSCSVCSKKDSLWVIPEEKAFRVVRDDGHLVEYESRSLKEKFCGSCGTQVTAEHQIGDLARCFLVNIRTIRSPYVNPFQLKYFTPLMSFQSLTLKRKTIMTASVVDKNEAKQIAVGASHALTQHNFVCHCQRIRAELLVTLQDQEIKEDNCSACVRNAYIGVYPKKEQVIIYGRENGFEYLTGRKYSGAVHCKTCGVQVFSNIYGPPRSMFDKLAPERKEKALKVYHKNMQLQPLNVRAVEGVDISSLHIIRSDEGTEGYKLDEEKH